MTLKLIAVGNRMPGWVESGYNEYAKRLPKHLKPQLVEIAPQKRRNVSVDTARRTEAERILAKVTATDHVVALDEKGKVLNTDLFAQTLDRWQQLSKPLALIIGGADGLHADVRARANETLSLSALTLPHPLVRVVLAEQLYRAWSLLNHHPYHRA